MDAAGDLPGIRIAIIIILLALSAFFSSSETALITVSPIRIRTLQESGDKRAHWVMLLLENKTKMLSTILIGNNAVNLTASSMLTVLVTDLFGSRMTGVATGVLTLLILIFGEITPKTVATLEAERYALKIGHVIYVLMNVLTPVITFVNFLCSFVLKALGVDPDKPGAAMTEEELRTIVKVGHETGVIETGEKEMINNVFDLGDSTARDVMVPRIDMAYIDIDADYRAIMDVFRREQYTRLPVCQDGADNVVGILNVKDMLLLDNIQDFRVRDHLREAYFTFESKKLHELMVDMRVTSNSIAIVLDEYGATAGIITLEDILEEIVGEIRDEYDADEEDNIKSLGEGEYLVDALINLDDVNERLGLKLSSEKCDTLGGFVLERMEHLPKAGETLELEGARIVVESVEKNRIDKIHLYLSGEITPD